MKATNNPVFNTAMQFCKAFEECIPEVVLYGYAKLLAMDESQVKSFISDGEMDDLEIAHKWFSDNKLDIKLVKAGMVLLLPVIPKSETRDRYKEFADYLTTEKEYVSSGDILEKAVQKTFIPIKDIFSTSSNIERVLNYQKDIREKYKEEKNEHADKQQGDNQSQSNKTDDKEKGKPVKDIESEQKSIANNTDTEVRNLGEVAKKYRELNASLLDSVIGQDQAILKFIQGYNQGELLKQTEKGNHPKTYFFFLGPPGVGKTLLAETAAANLGIPYKIFNMSEYASHQAHEGLIGISRMYKDSCEGSLVKFVRENPECLLVFDEIEKANINVIRQFLQILGMGSLRNVYREEDTSFKETTIIFTSNVGRELYAEKGINLTALPEKVIIDAIKKEKNDRGEPALPPEICSRIASGNTVMFNHLLTRQLAELTRINFDKIISGMKNEYGVDISYAKELPLLFLFNRGGEIDARIAVGQSGKFLKDEIYELMRQLENKNIDDNTIKKIQIDIDWKDIDPELKRLFKNTEKAEVLVFSDRKELFETVASDKYAIYCTNSIEEANELLKRDISAVYIDPFLGTRDDNETILSISDYNTDGVKLFHSLMEKMSGVPVFVLEIDRAFSEVDRRTFLQEGAVDTVALNTKHVMSFKRLFMQIMEELYMEKESQSFTQRGLVIGFNTKQEMTDSDGTLKITYYDLKKKIAVDVESRGSILSDAERPNVSFSDVIGAEKAKEELGLFVKYLQNPKKFLMNGGKAPKGVLLFGPPGTGKTMLARAMAGESNVTFLQTSATEFMNKYVGESEANIRRLFSKAKKYAPSIIFIDEIDAIGKKRTGSEFSSSSESMLNALLTEMDGFATTDITKPVFVLAATNYGVGSAKDELSSLDEALIRRFDNKIYVDLPKESERKQYILLALRKRGIDTVSENTAQSIAERTTGQSLAIIQHVIDLAERNAQKLSRKMNDDDLLTALEEYIYGDKKEHSADYYKEVAIHETGHAFVAYISGDKPSYITIESRGDFGGYMQHANQEEVTGYTKDEILSRICTSLAGRAAEQVFFGKDKSLNTGASSDLRQATEWAWRIICSYGMDEDQLVVLNKDDILKSSLASEYIAKVNDILKKEMEEAVSIITKNKDKIQAIADILSKENRLTGEEFEKLMKSEL